MRKRLPTSLEYALLGLIHMQPQSGYDLRKIFETTPMGHYSSSPGAMAPPRKNPSASTASTVVAVPRSTTMTGEPWRRAAAQAANGWGADSYRVLYDADDVVMAMSYKGDTEDDAVELAEALIAHVTDTMAMGEGEGSGGGLVFNMVSTANIDNALISYAGGESPIAGGTSFFNTIEAHHGANVRVANSTLQFYRDRLHGSAM